jgi:hypothetical protein
VWSELKLKCFLFLPSNLTAFIRVSLLSLSLAVVLDGLISRKKKYKKRELKQRQTINSPCLISWRLINLSVYYLKRIN